MHRLLFKHGLLDLLIRFLEFEVQSRERVFVLLGNSASSCFNTILLVLQLGQCLFREHALVSHRRVSRPEQVDAGRIHALVLKLRRQTIQRVFVNLADVNIRCERGDAKVDNRLSIVLAYTRSVEAAAVAEGFKVFF